MSNRKPNVEYKIDEEENWGEEDGYYEEDETGNFLDDENWFENSYKALNEHHGEPPEIDEEDEVIKTESIGAPVSEEGPPNIDEDYDVYGMDPETGERVGFESYDLDKFDETVESHNFAYEDEKFVDKEDPKAMDADDEAEETVNSASASVVAEETPVASVHHFVGKEPEEEEKKVGT